MSVISVIGGGSCAAPDYRRARQLGTLLAERGHVVLTGGQGGIMEAACRGADEAGGLTIAVLPGVVKEEANPYAKVVLTSGIGDARNIIVATSGDVVVAVGGGLGTLSEIAFALKHGRPVVGMGTWALAEHRVPGEGVHRVKTPEEAMAAVSRLLKEQKAKG